MAHNPCEILKGEIHRSNVTTQNMAAEFASDSRMLHIRSRMHHIRFNCPIFRNSRRRHPVVATATSSHSLPKQSADRLPVVPPDFNSSAFLHRSYSAINHQDREK